MTIFLMVILAATLLLCGGFFVYSSGILNICLGALLLACAVKNKKLKIPWTFEFLGLSVMTIFYILSPLWAVDRGMAWTGDFKFLPVVLWVILLYQIEAWQKNQIISYLPAAATVMVAAAFVFSKIEVTEEFFQVNGRLSGTFQYPNTFAMFLLVSIIILCFRMNFLKIKSLDYVYLIVCVIGLFLSGSLTVLILFLAFVLCFVVGKLLESKERNEIGKIATGESARAKTTATKTMIIMVAVALLIAVVAACAYISNSDLELKSSTFAGRLLYAYDAIKIIAKNPQGLGYYGYYFVQHKFQTGIYNVVHAHNDILQLILDVGVVPGIFCCCAMAKAFLGKRIPKLNRVVMIFMVIHLLFDYDFQFIAMFMIFTLMWDERKFKEVRCGVIGKIVIGLAVIGLIYNFSTVGLADWYYSNSKYDETLGRLKNHTLAQIYKMSEAETWEESNAYADEILEQNDYIAQCYEVKAGYALNNGDVLEMINYQEKAIELEPYNADRYNDYASVLCSCAQLYLEMEDYDSAKYCLDRAVMVEEKLSELEDSTSYLGNLIQDKMQYVLDDDVQILVNETREMVQ